MAGYESLDGALAAIYGTAAGAQMARYEAAQVAFGQHFSDVEGVDFFRAPGRVNLIGEHTDYNHGYVMPVALDKDVVLVARRRDDNRVRLRNMDASFPAIEFVIGEEISIGPTGEWGNYARGAAQTLAQALNGQADFGFDGVVSGAPPFGVPVGAGLSSSSALTVVMAVTLAHYAAWETTRWRDGAALL